MRTGEAYREIMNSHIVGIGGYSTGLGLKKIPRGTFVCAYAPTATVWEGKRRVKKLVRRKKKWCPFPDCTTICVSKDSSFHCSAHSRLEVLCF